MWPIQNNPKSSSGSNSIKQSISMTSLPRNGQTDTGDQQKPKLPQERPYNSLKKKRNSERDIWRNSWGSGHSYSSCSIYSNSAVVGKDEFWAALQNNYNYIMDTNLLDSCKEARNEINEGTPLEVKQQIEECNNSSTKLLNRCTKNGSTNPLHMRRWLREMENTLAKAPTFTQAMNMKSDEIQKSLRIHSDLYRKIASKTKVVAAYIRTTANVVKPSNDDSDRLTKIYKINNNLKALERRYHLLYLKAFEIQCMLEGLLGKKHLAQAYGTPTDSDEEPVAKQAKLCKAPDKLIATVISECVVSDISKHNNQLNGFKENSVQLDQVTASDADSEGSDADICNPFMPKESIGLASAISNEVLIKTVQQTMETNNGNEENDKITKANNILVNFDANEKIVQSQQQTLPPRRQSNELSKFNRSNRKSKNCAIFYFRHLDTDNENKEIFSSTSQVKSDVSSETDEWQFFMGNKPKSIDDNQKCIIVSPMNNKSTLINTVKDKTDEQSELKVISQNITKEISTGATEKCDMPIESTDNVKITSDILLNKQYLRESIKQLVMDAETLVRDDILQKSPLLCTNPFPELLPLPEAKEEPNGKYPPAHQKIKQIQEWLKHQSITTVNDAANTQSAGATTDCEASGEYTESDSSEHRSDSSDEPTNSITTTCMQEELNSPCTTTVDGSFDVLTGKEATAEVSVNQLKTIIRAKRKNTVRPWSVSCLSQLTQSAEHMKVTNVNGCSERLASYSISESALNTLSSPISPTHIQNTSLKNINTNSKSSLKKRKIRGRKFLVNKNSGSNVSDEEHRKPMQKQDVLIKSDSFSGRSLFQVPNNKSMPISSMPPPHDNDKKRPVDLENNEDNINPNHIIKPQFQLGAQTTFFACNNSALRRCNPEKEVKDLSLTGTDNSNFSEQAWDAYQEKYMSEPYSEGFDSDAARRLLEFGDDYRNFLDSQSDCCSSLSAANNFDSLSPKEKYLQFQYKNNNNNHHHQNQKINGKLPKCDEPGNIALRRRRTLALEYERRKKAPDAVRKNSFEECRKSPGFCMAPMAPSNKCQLQSMNGSERKLSMEMGRRKLLETDLNGRRKIKAPTEKLLYSSMKSSSSSSSSSQNDNDSGDEEEIKNLFSQSKNRLENTKMLKIRQYLLRPEDHNEIISTCRDNIRCFESILKGSKGCVLSKTLNGEILELQTAWRDLLQWSENISVARTLTIDMCNLTAALHKLGTQYSLNQCDSQSTIQSCIDLLKVEESELQKYRSTMLQLNASVHSWLTKEEIKLMKQNPTVPISGSNVSAESTNHTNNNQQIDAIHNDGHRSTISINLNGNLIEVELHKRLKNDVGEMYKAWDDADQRITGQLESLTASLHTWKQFENALNDFKEALGKDKGTLKGLSGALENGNEFVHHELAHDVKEVAKRLSETLENKFQQININDITEGQAVNQAVLPFISFSNGSLSDSGMSDGGGSSDYGLFEREKRLSALRRLAKQLELALAPGSAALQSIEQRVRAAEEELRSLQQTCRELIVKTAASQQQQPSLSSVSTMTSFSVEKNVKNIPPIVPLTVAALGERNNAKPNKKSPSCKCKNRRRMETKTTNATVVPSPPLPNISPSDPDPDDSSETVMVNRKNSSVPKNNWIWRIIKWMLPFHFILFVLIISLNFFEPHCCDNLNNFSLSFTPQLRYLKGRPPV